MKAHPAKAWIGAARAGTEKAKAKARGFRIDPAVGENRPTFFWG